MTMTYAQIRRAVLSHIGMYSIAGTPVPETYNNQEDYLLQIPQFFNEGLVNIRTSTKPLPEMISIGSDWEPVGDMLRYELPDDFYQLKSGGVSYLTPDGTYHKSTEYKLSGRKHILVPKYKKGKYLIEYYRYPAQLPEAPSDAYVLTEEVDVLQAAIVYAAAQLVMYDDEFRYATLYNDYESRLSRMSNGIAVEMGQVEDVYRIGGDYL